MVSKDVITPELGRTQILIRPENGILWRGWKDGQQNSMCSFIHSKPCAWPCTFSGKQDEHSPSIIPFKLTRHPPCARRCASLSWYAGSERPTLFLGNLGRRCGLQNLLCCQNSDGSGLRKAGRLRLPIQLFS